jgi:hypothetical protein
MDNISIGLFITNLIALCFAVYYKGRNDALKDWKNIIWPLIVHIRIQEQHIKNLTEDIGGKEDDSPGVH